MPQQRDFESELRVARRVMPGLLPRAVPSLDGFDIATHREQSYEVGGDYYEFIPLGDDRWGIAIADVVGKGVAASLLVAAMRTCLFLLARQDLAQRAIFRRANRFFLESVEAGKYVTLFYSVLDVTSRRMIYVNAGHPPPILLHRDGTVEFIEEGGLPLGMFEDTRYCEGTARLNDGDVLALYTDGITEAVSTDDEPYGLDRLIGVLRDRHDASAETICLSVMDDVRTVADSQVTDDQTIVVLKTNMRSDAKGVERLA